MKKSQCRVKKSHVRFFHGKASRENGPFPQSKTAYLCIFMQFYIIYIMIIRMYPIDDLRSKTRTG